MRHASRGRRSRFFSGFREALGPRPAQVTVQCLKCFSTSQDKAMTEEPKKQPEGTRTAVGMVMGMSFGVAFGSAFGDVSNGLIFGMVFGLMVGACLDALADKPSA